ncbi:MAG: hypothetical protein ACREF5_01545 [Candidatus Saccharimonadales bacterium]
MKRFAILLSIGFLLAGVLGVILNGSTYAANTPASEACQGVALTSGGSGCGDNGAQVGNVVIVIINLLSAIVGIAAVIMVIIAGLRFTTSAGNPQSVAGARSALLYALVGLVVVALAQVLVHFVLSQAINA